MIETMKSYLISVTAAALICGALCSLVGNSGSISKLLKLLCGLFLTATVIKPVVDVELEDIYSFVEGLSVSSEQAVFNGKEIAADEMERIIKEKTAAYILDKAKTLGAELEVEVVLEDLVPVRVNVTGDVSPFAKSNLSACICQDLGIPPEEQVWNRS